MQFKNSNIFILLNTSKLWVVCHRFKCSWVTTVIPWGLKDSVTYLCTVYWMGSTPAMAIEFDGHIWQLATGYIVFFPIFLFFTCALICDKISPEFDLENKIWLKYYYIIFYLFTLLCIFLVSIIIVNCCLKSWCKYLILLYHYKSRPRKTLNITGTGLACSQRGWQR